MTATPRATAGLVVEALHNYQAQERHQLTLVQGEKISVLEKDPSGWWIGRNRNGNVGIFPSTYVQEVAYAPPSAEVTKNIAATRLVRELSLSSALRSGLPGYSMGELDDAQSPVRTADDDDLFAMSSKEEEAELRKQSSLRSRMLEEAQALLDALIAEQSAPQGEDEETHRHRQHLTIVGKRRNELIATENRLCDDVEDLMYELKDLSIGVPAVIPIGGKGPAPTPSQPPSSSPAQGSIAPPKTHASKPRKVKSKPQPVEKPQWLQEVHDDGAVRYLIQLQEQFNSENQELDQLEGALERLSRETKEYESQVNSLSANAEDKAALEKQELEKATNALQVAQDAAKEAKHAAKEQLQQHQQKCDKIEEEAVALNANVEKGKEVFLALQAELDQLAKDGESNTSVVDALRQELQEITQRTEAMKKAASEKRAQIADSVARQRKALEGQVVDYRKLERERRVIYNEIQELKGNLRVYCRIKPCLGKEVNEHVHEVDDMTLKIFDESTLRESTFEFDMVLGEKATQPTIFEEVRPLATSVLDGYNVCIFAYGQTGSGKTYTMEGPPDNRGVNFRTVTELFAIAQERKDEYELGLSVSIIEVYNNVAFDLQSGRVPLKIRWGGDDQGVVIEPLVKSKVTSVDDVQTLLSAAYANRKVAGTDSNAHSSRSHCILTVYVHATNLSSKATITGKLHLIDLAGSERVKKSGVDGDRLKEATHINTSLTHLKTVINALANKSGHVSYRNSILTSILQDSLGGNCKCLMFANISPLTVNIPETICTCKYAAEARKVEVGKATANVKAGARSPATQSPAAQPLN